jgi:hypothetical protein
MNCGLIAVAVPVAVIATRNDMWIPSPNANRSLKFAENYNTKYRVSGLFFYCYFGKLVRYELMQGCLLNLGKPKEKIALITSRPTTEIREFEEHGTDLKLRHRHY